jgi:hypothetical protein
MSLAALISPRQLLCSLKVNLPELGKLYFFPIEKRTRNMERLNLTRSIKKLYDSGANVMKFLRQESGSALNDEETILLSYEAQAGNYVDAFFKDREAYTKYAAQISGYISKVYGDGNTLLEVGIGEATTFATVAGDLDSDFERCYGLDISWSRLNVARQFLRHFTGGGAINLMTGTLFQMPFMDNSIDIVYTAHSLEPNGGREADGLRELYRITQNYLFLFEPGYEFANSEQKARMLEHGYITNLYASAKELGYNIVEHKLLEYSMNPGNPTAVLVIEKNKEDADDRILCCPITRTSLQRYDDAMYSPESFLMYPIIKNIMCLLPENAIPGFKFL